VRPRRCGALASARRAGEHLDERRPGDDDPARDRHHERDRDRSAAEVLGEAGQRMALGADAVDDRLDRRSSSTTMTRSIEWISTSRSNRATGSASAGTISSWRNAASLRAA
jgi:hypothetical protein